MMFAQANSEHCRHKIFNADWLDRRRAAAPKSLVRDDPQHATQHSPDGVLSAYKDNAAVIDGRAEPLVLSGPRDWGLRATSTSRSHLVMKVETHNHPTAISPYPGRRDRLGRRDPRRGRDRPRRET